MIKVDLSSAVLIHRRLYKDSSLLLDFYTKEYGKIRLVGRGIRKSKTNIQMFQHLKISFAGRGDLKTLTHWEVDDLPREMKGDTLILCMYINELISILIHENDPHPKLFDAYIDFINSIVLLDEQTQLWSLRLFESSMLSELGYGLDYRVDIKGNRIDENKCYEYQQHLGFIEQSNGKICGKLLGLLSTSSLGNIPNKEQIRVCRNLNRARLSPLLGDKVLKSRELFFKG